MAEMWVALVRKLKQAAESDLESFAMPSDSVMRFELSSGVVTISQEGPQIVFRIYNQRGDKVEQFTDDDLSDRYGMRIFGDFRRLMEDNWRKKSGIDEIIGKIIEELD